MSFCTENKKQVLKNKTYWADKKMWQLLYCANCSKVVRVVWNFSYSFVWLFVCVSSLRLVCICLVEKVSPICWPFPSTFSWQCTSCAPIFFRRHPFLLASFFYCCHGWVCVRIGWCSKLRMCWCGKITNWLHHQQMC